MNRITWKDQNGNCHCESCGKIVAEEELQWEKWLGYCSDCYAEILSYENTAETFSASQQD